MEEAAHDEKSGASSASTHCRLRVGLQTEMVLPMLRTSLRNVYIKHPLVSRIAEYLCAETEFLFPYSDRCTQADVNLPVLVWDDRKIEAPVFLRTEYAANLVRASATR